MVGTSQEIYPRERHNAGHSKAGFTLSLDAIIPFKLSHIIGRPSIHTRKATARAFTAVVGGKNEFKKPAREREREWKKGRRVAAEWWVEREKAGYLSDWKGAGYCTIFSFLRFLLSFSSVSISFISSLSLILLLFLSFLFFFLFFFFLVFGIVISSIFSPLSFRLLDISVFYFLRLPLGPWNKLLGYVGKRGLIKAEIFIFFRSCSTLFFVGSRGHCGLESVAASLNDHAAEYFKLFEETDFLDNWIISFY